MLNGRNELKWKNNYKGSVIPSDEEELPMPMRKFFFHLNKIFNLFFPNLILHRTYPNTD